ncbi:hypothetical protein FKM82_005381 [Ascaphus truei]
MLCVPFSVTEIIKNMLHTKTAILTPPSAREDPRLSVLGIQKERQFGHIGFPKANVFKTNTSSLFGFKQVGFWKSPWLLCTLTPVFLKVQ